jgi:phosphoribosylformylglycinamidine cyclo-ligase
LPSECRAVVDAASWTPPPIFQLIQRGGAVSTEEMREVFNIGCGLVVIAPESAVDAVQHAAKNAGVDTWVLGEVQAGPREVRFI